MSLFDKNIVTDIPKRYIIQQWFEDHVNEVIYRNYAEYMRPDQWKRDHNKREFTSIVWDELVNLWVVQHKSKLSDMGICSTVTGVGDPSGLTGEQISRLLVFVRLNSFVKDPEIPHELRFMFEVKDNILNRTGTKMIMNECSCGLKIT